VTCGDFCTSDKNCTTCSNSLLDHIFAIIFHNSCGDHFRNDKN
jgi:hypothetical protein